MFSLLLVFLKKDWCKVTNNILQVCINISSGHWNLAMGFSWELENTTMSCVYWTHCLFPLRKKLWIYTTSQRSSKKHLQLQRRQHSPFFQQSYHEFCSLIIIDLYSFKVSDHYCYFLDENTLVLKFLKTVCCWSVIEYTFSKMMNLKTSEMLLRSKSFGDTEKIFSIENFNPVAIRIFNKCNSFHFTFR